MPDGNGAPDRAVSGPAAGVEHRPWSDSATEELARVGTWSTARRRWVLLRTGVHRIRGGGGRGPRVGTVVGVVVAVLVLAASAAWLVSVVFSPTWWDLSLIDGPVPLMLAGGGLAGLVAVLLAGRGRRWWQRYVPVCVLVAGGVLGATAAALAVWQPWPDALPPLVWAATAAAVLALTLAAAALAMRRTGWGRRLFAVTAAGLVVLGAAAQVNAYFAQFPTPRALFGLPPAGQVDFTGLRLSPHPARTAGTGRTGGPRRRSR